jgi:hypothetical protein
MPSKAKFYCLYMILDLVVITWVEAQLGSGSPWPAG